MPRYQITAPVEGCSCTVAGVLLTNSVGVTEDENAVNYFRRHGYKLDAAETNDETPKRPAQSATKAEWVGYAVRVGGMVPDDAEAMTKADLIERFGGQQDG